MFNSKMRWILFGVIVVTLSLGAVVMAQDSVEITMTGSGGATFEWLRDYVKPKCEAQLAEAGMNVTISPVEFIGTGEDKFQQFVLDLGVGAGADLLDIDGFWIPEWAEGGLVSPLDQIVGPEVADWEGWEQIPAGLQDILGFEGNIYGVANGTDARVIWYRSDMLEEAGLPADWAPTSWEDVLDAARQVKEAFPDSTPIQLNAGLGMGEATTMQGYLMALLGTGHHIYDFDSGKWIIRSQGILDTLNLYKTIYVDEGLGNDRFQLVQDGRDQSFGAFRDGEVAMLVEGDYFWRSVLAPGSNFEMENRDDVVRFAAMPAQEPGAGYNGQDFVTISGGTGYIINQNTEHPAEAWAVMTCMYSAELLEDFNSFQPRIRARQDVPVTGDDTMSAIATDVLSFTTVRPPLPEYNQISAEAQLMTERVVSGEMTPEEAMDAYATAVTDIVGEDNVVDMTME